ncbi:unnamed protein product [Parnassius apollo]|uniref:(apollo) hypothetical protein n=1 Tax=Parnassius apollo TaxID=110799 RepID=A0A8S3WK31_PARAO|nr:unnamed protein product [Parnassius apollo]
MRPKKLLKDDDIARTLAAMQSESSEDDDEDEVLGCRDDPYPDFDINKPLDKVEDCADRFSLEELKSVLESNSTK